MQSQILRSRSGQPSGTLGERIARNTAKAPASPPPSRRTVNDFAAQLVATTPVASQFSRASTSLVREDPTIYDAGVYYGDEPEPAPSKGLGTAAYLAIGMAGLAAGYLAIRYL